MKKCECSCNRDIVSDIKDNTTAIWLFAICGFLLGIIVGFAISPIKKGISIGNGNKADNNENCSVVYNNGEDDDDEIKF